MESETVVRARARIALYNEQGVHMCLKAGCKLPVHGEEYLHCTKHFDFHERDLQEALAEPLPVLGKETHPVVRSMEEALIEILQERRERALKSNERVKETALSLAYITVAAL